MVVVVAVADPRSEAFVSCSTTSLFPYGRTTLLLLVVVEWVEGVVGALAEEKLEPIGKVTGQVWVFVNLLMFG